MRFAIVCDNVVVDIVIYDYIPVFPKTNDNKELIPVEIEENLKLKIGDIYDNGNFISTEDDFSEQELSWQELDDILKSELLLTQQEILLKIESQQELLEKIMKSGDLNV